MKNYEAPKFELVRFYEFDILTTSDDTSTTPVDENDPGGNNTNW